ncbi:tetratricopeptide repeat protein 19, mitochondrial-like isoform X2 [Clavelina lepadiformis]
MFRTFFMTQLVCSSFSSMRLSFRYMSRRRPICCHQQLSKASPKFQKNSQCRPGFLSVLLSFSLFGTSTSTDENMKQDLNEQNQDISDLIQKGKKMLVKGEHTSKAEMLYLHALHIALERKDRRVIARVQDLLANLALTTNQLDKAEPLFRNVLQNLIATGTSQTDPAVLEISLKLASIYAQRGEKELAITGYEWCSETCRNNVKEMEKKNLKTKEYSNGLALLGMILDSYGRYLHDISENKLAFAYTAEALEISKLLFGEKDIRTLVLLNDLSSIKSTMGDYNKALEYARRAIKVAEENPSIADASEKAIFYANLSYIYVQQGRTEEAEATFKQALVEVSKTKDNELKSHIASLINTLPLKNKSDDKKDGSNN